MAKHLAIVNNQTGNSFEFLIAAKTDKIFEEKMEALDTSMRESISVGQFLWYCDDPESYESVSKDDFNYINNLFGVLSLFCKQRQASDIKRFYIDQWLPFLSKLNELRTEDLPQEIKGVISVEKNFLPVSFFSSIKVIRIFLPFYENHPDLKNTDFYKFFINGLKQFKAEDKRYEEEDFTKLIAPYVNDIGVFKETGFDYIIENLQRLFFREYEDRYSKKVLDGKSFQLSELQKQAITNETCYTLIRSSAGSGKTAVLIARFFYLVECKKIKPQKILLLVYTNQVCDEINEKIAKLWNQEDYGPLRSGPAKTIDACAYGIIRDKDGITPNLLTYIENKKYNTTDHNRADILLQRGSFLNDDAFIKSLEEVESAYFDYLEDSKHKESRDYVSYIDQSGPFSLRSYREKWIYEFLFDLYHDANGNKIKGFDLFYELPVGDKTPDFTIKRCGEKYIYEHYAKKKGKIDNVEYNGQDRDSTYKKQEGDEYYFSTFGEGKNRDDLLKELIEHLRKRGLIPQQKEARITKIATKHSKERIVVKYIKYFRLIRGIIVDNCLEQKDLSEKIQKLGGFPRLFWEKVYSPLVLEIKKLYRNADYMYTDFSDSIGWAKDILDKDKNSSLRGNYSFSHILIDEYQDLTRSRFELLKALCELGDSHLMAVGDDWQSIYSFANSDLSLFHSFETDWKDAKCLNLDESFRFGDGLAKLSSAFVLNCLNGGGSNLTKRDVKGNVDLNTTIEPLSYECEKSNSFDESDKIQISIIEEKIKNIQETEPEAVFAIISRFREERHPLFSLWRSQMDPSGKHIKYLTMHQSKGATVDYAFIVSCNEKSVPFIKSEDELVRFIREQVHKKDYINEQENEERRLFYVALTRAHNKVFILYDRKHPSKYVSEIWT